MVSFYFPPEYSGSAIQALNLSRHLQRLGIEPFIVTASLGSAPAREVFDGIPVFRLKVAGSGVFQILSFWFSLSRFLLRSRRQFDVIHAHGALQHGIVSLLGRALHRPTILKVAMHGSDIAFHRHGRVWGRLTLSMVRRFDRYVATTSDIAEEFGARGLDTTRVRLIPNGVETATYAPLPPAERDRLRRRLGLPAGPLVTFAGIINERKNVDGILRIWRAATERGADGHLVLIGPVPAGGSSYEQKLRHYIDEHSLGHRVSFLGQQVPLAPYLQASDVFLFPSRQEGMPNCVLEAMACGLGCVVSGSVGVESIISHGESGFLAGIDDEPAFVEHLCCLLGDHSLRERVGGAAREAVVARFSLTSVAARYAALYRELLNGSRVGVERIWVPT